MHWGLYKMARVVQATCLNTLSQREASTLNQFPPTSVHMNSINTGSSTAIMIHSLPDQLLLIVLQWRHNGPDSVSNHQPHDCLLNRLFRRRSKKTSKLCVTGLCAGNSPGTGEFPAQMASYAENISFDDVIMVSRLRGILLPDQTMV